VTPLGGAIWGYFLGLICAVFIYGYFIPESIFLFAPNGRLERPPQKRTAARSIAHATIRAILFACFALAYDRGKPLSCVQGIDIPCPECWALGALIAFMIFVIAQEIIRIITAPQSTQVQPVNKYFLDASFAASDATYWLGNARAAKRAQLWRRIGYVAEFIQHISNCFPSFALWIHFIVIVQPGAFSCSDTDFSRFWIYFSIMTIAVFIQAFVFVLWQKLLWQREQSAILLTVRFLRPFLTTALWVVTVGYASGSDRLVCLSQGGLFGPVLYILVPVTITLSACEYVLQTVYVTPTRDFATQTAAMDTLIAKDVQQVTRQKIHAPTRMYPHKHWGDPAVVIASGQVYHVEEE